MESIQLEEVASLIKSWEHDPHHLKECFLRLKKHLRKLEGVELSCIARPGISYSLRAAHANQTGRGLFAMVDIIDDDPKDRWLSVCFYGDMINDPGHCGEDVPEGLLGEDATCFDICDDDAELVEYVESRLDEAFQVAAKIH